MVARFQPPTKLVVAQFRIFLATPGNFLSMFWGLFWRSMLQCCQWFAPPSWARLDCRHCSLSEFFCSLFSEQWPLEKWKVNEKSLTSSTCSLGAFWAIGTHLPSEKFILLDFSIPRVPIWSPSLTDLYFWYLFVAGQSVCQQTNTKYIAGQPATEYPPFLAVNPMENLKVKTKARDPQTW